MAIESSKQSPKGGIIRGSPITSLMKIAEVSLKKKQRLRWKRKLIASQMEDSKSTGENG